MRIEEQHIGNVSILTVHGEFDARTAPEACRTLDKLFETLRVRLVINLEGVEIVTSTAISFLIDAAKRTRKHGGDAVLSEPTKLLRKTLATVGIGNYLEMFDSNEAGVAYFRGLEVAVHGPHLAVLHGHVAAAAVVLADGVDPTSCR